MGPLNDRTSRLSKPIATGPLCRIRRLSDHPLTCLSFDSSFHFLLVSPKHVQYSPTFLQSHSSEKILQLNHPYSPPVTFDTSCFPSVLLRLAGRGACIRICVYFFFPKAVCSFRERTDLLFRAGSISSFSRIQKWRLEGKQNRVGG